MSSNLTGSKAEINTVYASSYLDGNIWQDLVVYEEVPITSQNGRVPSLTKGQMGFYNCYIGSGSTSQYPSIYGPDDDGTYMVFVVADTTSLFPTKGGDTKFPNISFVGIKTGATLYFGGMNDGVFLILFRVS